MNRKQKIAVSFILITLGVFCRLLPHAWNFTPIVAIALFAGVYLGKKYAVILPLSTMLLGDLFIGFYAWKLMLVVYGCFALVGILGVMIKKHKTAETMLAGSILASVLFFLATNWAVWQFSPWYAKTWQGLLECYTLALPFFRNTLLGNVFYTGVLFGAYEVILLLVKQRKLSYNIIKLK